MTKSISVLKKELSRMLADVREASLEASQLDASLKNKILIRVAREIQRRKKWLMAENAKDLKSARRAGLSSALIDRLTLTAKRLEDIAGGVKAVASLTDPVGKVLHTWKRPNGLKLSKVAVPLGVILIIYESRPNVTADCAALCLKSGNAVILRGGREAYFSNQALARIFEEALKTYKVHPSCVSFVKTTDRAAVDWMLKQEQVINLVIPRGGESLIRKVVRSSRIPVIKHYQGICHVFVDAQADLKKASEIVCNAKLQRPGVCNAMETLLVHEKIAARFLPDIGKKLSDGGCELRADHKALRYLSSAKAAKASDYGREFLDKILAIRVVPNVEAAMQHIQKFGSAHTDAIVTQDKKTAEKFKKGVDSAAVMVNASTRFSDGFEFGFGAEIGISTDKIHARGPMGLEGLTSYKYLVEGNGQIRGG